MRTMLTMLVPALVLVACDLGGGEYDFDEWDTNRDGQLSFDEFTEGFTDTYDRWDEDRDDNVVVDELATGLFSDWDRDNSTTLSQDEFNDRFFSGPMEQFADFSLWDANEDDAIDEDEFLSGWRFSGLFDTWNQDDQEGLTIDELGRGLFDAWDGDGDGALGDNEFGFGFL